MGHLVLPFPPCQKSHDNSDPLTPLSSVSQDAPASDSVSTPRRAQDPSEHSRQSRPRKTGAARTGENLSDYPRDLRSGSGTWYKIVQSGHGRTAMADGPPRVVVVPSAPKMMRNCPTADNPGITETAQESETFSSQPCRGRSRTRGQSLFAVWFLRNGHGTRSTLERYLPRNGCPVFCRSTTAMVPAVQILPLEGTGNATTNPSPLMGCAKAISQCHESGAHHTRLCVRLY